MAGKILNFPAFDWLFGIPHASMINNKLNHKIFPLYKQLRFVDNIEYIKEVIYSVQYNIGYPGKVKNTYFMTFVLDIINQRFGGVASAPYCIIVLSLIHS